MEKEEGLPAAPPFWGSRGWQGKNVANDFITVSSVLFPEF